MKVAAVYLFGILSVLTVTFSAPIAENEQRPEYLEYDTSKLNYQRGQRLSENYYAVSPCAAAAAAAAGSNGPARSYTPDMMYPSNVGHRFIPSTYDYGSQGYTGNMYRTEDQYNDNREVMSYSDMNFLEQAPMARSNYGIASSSLPLNAANLASLSGQLVHPVAPVYGMFPNGNVGGCNVPLLFSCSPSIVPGRIVKAEPHVPYNSPVNSQPDAYRDVSDHYLHALQANHAEQMVDHTSPVKSDAVHLSDKHT